MKWAGASLVVQWLGICLPVQGTRVRSLVWEDPTCRGATRPMSHNYWACALEPTSHNYWSPRAHGPRAHALQQREATAMRSPRNATKSNPCWPQLEKAASTKTQCSQSINQCIKRKKRKEQPFKHFWLRCTQRTRETLLARRLPLLWTRASSDPRMQRQCKKCEEALWK